MRIIKKSIIILLVIVFGTTLHIPLIAKALENDKKQIYLTFDDGPSNVTSKILDILNSNDIKATFFIIGSRIEGREDIIRRIKDEGHSIGLHSYSHKCSEIYSDRDAFIKEMYMTRDKLFEITGKRYNIIRFPQGSIGHLNYELLEILHQCNFRIYDWNMAVSDGINYRIQPYRLYREATSKKKKPNTIFLLMHCDVLNKNTCDALQSIIDYYKELNYEFSAIKDDTREFYFPIRRRH